MVKFSRERVKIPVSNGQELFSNGRIVFLGHSNKSLSDDYKKL